MRTVVYDKVTPDDVHYILGDLKSYDRFEWQTDWHLGSSPISFPSMNLLNASTDCWAS